MTRHVRSTPDSRAGRRAPGDVCPAGARAAARPHRRARGPRPAGSSSRSRGTLVLAAVVAGALRCSGSPRATHRRQRRPGRRSLAWLPVTGGGTPAATCAGPRPSSCSSSTWRSSSTGPSPAISGAAGTAGGLLLWLSRGFRGDPGLRLPVGDLRRARLGALAAAAEQAAIRIASPISELPFVSLHVPAHNEPPDMVIDTLRSLLGSTTRGTRSSSSTTTPTTRRSGGRSRRWCARHGVKFAHLEDWPGYKSGALNYALRELTDPRAEIIGVVDSDYQLEPGFLRRCAPAVRRLLGRLHPGAAGLPRLVAGHGTTGGCTTPTSTSSRSPSRHGTSGTGRSSPARWA